MFKLDKILRALCFLSILLIIQSCDNQNSNINQLTFSKQPIKSDKNYSFAIHPLHNPERLFKIFNPLILYLSKHIKGVTFTLEASRNYADFNKKMDKKLFDFALPNPYQTIQAIDNGYNVFAKMGDDKNFRGIIIVRKDSTIKKFSDLRGKKVSYPAPTALAATMMPQYLLYKNGINVLKDLTNIYVGSQESSIMNVYYKNSDAAATWPTPWLALQKERPELTKELYVKWETPPLINNSLVAKNSIPKEMIQQVTFLLLSLNNSKEGLEILQRMELSTFQSASNNTYDVIRSFIKEFSLKVRPI